MAEVVAVTHRADGSGADPRLVGAVQHDLLRPERDLDGTFSGAVGGVRPERALDATVVRAADNGDEVAEEAGCDAVRRGGVDVER